MTSRRPAAVLAALLCAATLSGCFHPDPVQPSPATRANAPRPAGVQDPAVIPSAAAGAGSADCQPRKSLAPQGSLPAPGAMPSGSTMDRIARRGRLLVGVDQNTYLFGFRDPATGELVGFDLDIAHEVARAIFGDPNRIQFIAITYGQRIPAVSSGQVDLVADTMTINCDRWKQVNFSTVYYDAGQKVLVPRASKVTGIQDLGGQKVCAAAGSTSIQNVANAKSKPIPVAVDDWTDCLVLLQQGQVAAISTDDTILAGMAAQDPFTKIVGNAFTSEPYGLAIAKDNTDFVRFVNGVLEQIRADGRWKRIYVKWVGEPAINPPAAEYR